MNWFTPATPFVKSPQFLRWEGGGKGDGMDYLGRPYPGTDAEAPAKFGRTSSITQRSWPLWFQLVHRSATASIPSPS